jgi:prolyl-tRNA editing enzyme YbaK/EbsC (Cys-tRNA(Pro) deacylase)
VYCGGGTTTTMLRIRSADLDALLKPRRAAVAERG